MPRIWLLEEPSPVFRGSVSAGLAVFDGCALLFLSAGRVGQLSPEYPIYNDINICQYRIGQALFRFKIRYPNPLIDIVINTINYGDNKKNNPGPRKPL